MSVFTNSESVGS